MDLEHNKSKKAENALALLEKAVAIYREDLERYDAGEEMLCCASHTDMVCAFIDFLVEAREVVDGD